VDGRPGRGRQRWYELLTLQELAVLIITRARSDRVYLALERAHQPFGMTADTLGRGLKGSVGSCPCSSLTVSTT